MILTMIRIVNNEIDPKIVNENIPDLCCVAAILTIYEITFIVLSESFLCTFEDLFTFVIIIKVLKYAQL